MLAIGAARGAEVRGAKYYDGMGGTGSFFKFQKWASFFPRNLKKSMKKKIFDGFVLFKSDRISTRTRNN